MKTPLLYSFALAAVLLIGTINTTSAQSSSSFSLRGVVIEMKPQQEGQSQNPRDRFSPLQGANLVLYTESDTLTQFRGTTSGSDGRFEITRVPNGNYILVATFVGFQTQRIPVSVNNADVERIRVMMTDDPAILEELRISGLRPPVEVQGDTTIYNAEGVRLNPDATAEDLVRRLPGITVEDGQVVAQGEQVRRVLLDGQEFFGDDALLTLRNLPAEIIGQIELFDQQSDQAQFTGFRDGNEVRTLNIRSRPGMNVGQFGRGNLSGGTENRYLGSGNFNYFNGPRRISVVGLSNNINQMNFSGEDLAGINQAAGGGGGRGMMGGRGGPGGGWGGGAARQFMTGGQSGLNTVHSVGLNYINRWDKTNVNASYFFNATNNANTTSAERQYLSEVNADQTYTDRNVSNSENFNHRINGRIEHTFNQTYSAIVTPRIQFRDTDRSGNQFSRTFEGQNTIINESVGRSRNDTFNYDIDNTVLLRRRFETRGRTLSANIRTSMSDNSGERYQFNDSYFRNNLDEIVQQQLDLNTDIKTGGYSVSSDIQFTEPIGSRSQLQLSYRPSFQRENSEQNAFQFSPETNSYSVLNPELTNRYVNDVIANNAGAGYRYNHDALNFNVNVNLEHSILDGSQTFPVISDTRTNYFAVLPSANIRYRLGQGRNIGANYRTNQRLPSISQLQDVVDISNPLQVRGGNPNLNPQYSHNFSGRIQRANTEKATFFFAAFNVGYTTDYIGNASIVAVRDTTIRPGVTIGRGSRYTSPANLGDSWNLRSFFNFSFPVTMVKSNLSLNSGISYTLQPTSENNVITDARTIGLSGGTSLNSNISQNVDFNISYNGNYSIVENAANVGINNNFYTGRASARLNLIPGGRFVISSDFNLTHYSGLGDDFESRIIYWNGAVGYKFLENNAAEIRLMVFDILGQNNSVSRIVQEGYVEDVRSNVLTRFAMLNFSYNFRRFAGRS